MKIILSGYNLDISVIEDARARGVDEALLTPEPVSAAYARISRDPRPVDELRARAVAEVEKARKSNRTIIFEMGHHSVAEHAVFNYDVIGLSRLAIESLEAHRLCSFTEKSQRYITLSADFVVPEEIRGTGIEKDFRDHIAFLSSRYDEANAVLLEYQRKKHPDLQKTAMGRRTIEGWAKEDARYLMPLAAEGQLGLTVNARNIELVIRRFAAHPLAEVREMGRRLYETAVKVAPSLVLFVEASPFDRETYSELKKLSRHALESASVSHSSSADVSLVDFTPDADRQIAAALLVTLEGIPFAQAREITERMIDADLRRLFEEGSRRLELYDAVLREFEHVHLTFDIVLSSAAFGQLKRHRIATITSGPYDPGLGVTVPPVLRENGLDGILREAASRASELGRRIGELCPDAAPYALLNAHRRRVLMTLNARELYHVSRLREDGHAQWDIRRISAEMSRLGRDKMPLIGLLLGGKDQYPGIYERVYGAKPKVVLPPPPKDEI